MVRGGLIRLTGLTGLLMLGVAFWKSGDIGAPGPIEPGLRRPPAQEAADRPPFTVEAGGIRYEVKPLYHYDLYGMVVSRHDARGWRDSIHRQWNDALNIGDVCVIWGGNLDPAVYTAFHFSSGEFTCNYSTRLESAYRAFDPASMSNNHLLTIDPALIERIESARAGDQIHFRGWLAEYSHDQGFHFHRGTSIVRTDTGNGACETVFLDDFEILRTGSRWWSPAGWLGGLLLVLALAGWMAAPIRIRD